MQIVGRWWGSNHDVAKNTTCQPLVTIITCVASQFRQSRLSVTHNNEYLYLPNPDPHCSQPHPPITIRALHQPYHILHPHSWNIGDTESRDWKMRPSIKISCTWRHLYHLILELLVHLYLYLTSHTLSRSY